MPEWSIGLAAAGAVLLVGLVVGVAWRRQNGTMRDVASGAAPSADPATVELLADLGVRAGVPATLLQFSSAFCAPCRAARRACAEVVELFDGVDHVEVDAESHLEAVRALDVRRTPTVLVIDAERRVVRRSSGRLDRYQLAAAIAPLLEPQRM